MDNNGIEAKVDLLSLISLFSGIFYCRLLRCIYKCNKPGHLARDCTSDIVCRNCGQPGHVAHDCTNEPVCRNCGQSGHLARDCQNEPVCHKCGKTGHIARDCTD